MVPAALLSDSQQRGPLLIAAGLAIVLGAQIWPGLPIASAIMLIGCGATTTVQARSELLHLMSLATYAMLGCLVVAAQTHAANRVGGLLVADHLTAAALLVLLARIKSESPA